MSIKEWVFPTAKNNYRAKLVTVPALSFFLLALLLVNTVLGSVPARSVLGAISPTDLLDLHNLERAKANLTPLKYSSVLSNSAQKKAQAMLAADCWSHFCPEGKSPWDFFNEAGYDYIYAGENLAEGFRDNEEVMVAWMNSETHKENILRGQYTEIGFGVAHGDFQGIPNSTIIAVHFGTPATIDTQQPTQPPQPDLDAPAITSPKNESWLNTNQPTISGQANSKKVEIFDGSQALTVIDANQGIFTYRPTVQLDDGQHTLTARGLNNSEVSELSAPVKFYVDTQPQPLTLTDLTILPAVNQKLTLQIQKQSLQSLTTTIMGQRINFTKLSDQLWQAEVDQQQMLQNPTIQLETVDLAGNAWQGNLDSGNVLGIAVPIDQTSAAQASLLKSQVNLGILIILIVLFGIDMLVLLRSGQTRDQSAKGHFHFGILIVVGILVITGSLFSQIGFGLFR